MRKEIGTVLHSNEHYEVVIQSAVDGSAPMDVTYGLVNKTTGVTEVQISLLPNMIQTADVASATLAVEDESLDASEGVWEGVSGTVN